MFIVSLLLIKIKVIIVFGNHKNTIPILCIIKKREYYTIYIEIKHIFVFSIPLYICCRHLVKSRICQLNAYYEKSRQIMYTKKPVILVIKYG